MTLLACPMQLLATFDNGRLEAFLDMRTLTPVELTEPAMALRIARRLRQFHRCKVSLPGVDPAQSELFATMWRSYDPKPVLCAAPIALCACVWVPCCWHAESHVCVPFVG